MTDVINCQNISKEFYLLDERFNWRIVFRNFSQKFNSFNALNDVSLSVPKGKILGILGKNGAGKSTLLRVLAGVYPPSRGVVNVTGSLSGLFELGGFGNIRQTGESYAYRFLEIHGVPKELRADLVQKIKEFSELKESFNKPIYSYSSGMAARLYFSTATELEYQIYLIDELLSVGDEHFQTKCWKRLRQRFTHGASGVLVTHDWPAVLKLCESSCIVEQGKITHSGSSETIVQQYLNLAPPNKELAEIHFNASSSSFVSGKDCQIALTIELKRPLSVALNYSIELFRAGHGWELLMINPQFIALDCLPGMNQCVIKIDKLPLVAGEYYLNLFLKSLDDDINDNQLDSRSWTYGNGIKIKVMGEQKQAITQLPWRMRAIEV